MAVAEREEILKRAELARRELRSLLLDDGVSVQGRQRLTWVIHDLDVIVQTALQQIIDDVDSPSVHIRRQRDLLG